MQDEPQQDDALGNDDAHLDAPRRDLLKVAAIGTGVVATGAAVWPLVNQMNPSADVLAEAKIRVDISAVQRGEQITVLWQGRPVFIRARTDAEIARARADHPDQLPDGLARNANLDPNAPADDANRALSPDGIWLVQMGVCTHLGCVPVGQSGDYDGWFCPCHGSHYDTAGRIRKGPAPRNLPVPRAIFIDDTTIELG
ncbi:ubiquinol-cytochrome c reductase iron-sulfur subunit [Ketogulonicigenium vulgare]|uniref:Ubiquinol-cytochrome c reductase iron-sulfur subunit n=1 Tax=Ketogulonicigenium vulgare (strain WSH-001) TaxID=759362 RepID=F9Y6N6_KETVW|nr:ubiquinol-cytochrome c reductase iron-sulfur subunit [Ketogulonicigenium vulgare]ADO43898.1 ubiquinol-cytochrome c reductase, iron-sulfur subunit [Ketogulonicigenium vulgare Y25]AEM42156.1 Ubiquinol-cytochrome c reductase iron-sulfur subunit [Ketogulonicigenium vulgare WSH-001]ALJ79780.1 ubiquinol-cytochrome c reductase iron-sulfur subunit [Ketogulonicigenium vulgare]ANW32700.1 ubiquinol-cytochrome c reductase iron-sulfur subunit [Ketogulonicigenium vulgare]AOZ55932.1 ubiquinol-cytochrome C